MKGERGDSPNVIRVTNEERVRGGSPNVIRVTNEERE